jgi:uncharacterized membrane protein YhaH (DUF805 family)
MIAAEIIDWNAAWQAIWTAAVAGVGVTVVFSVAVLGATRTADMRRDRRPGQAAFFAVVALVAVAGTLAAVVYAITLITTK